MSERNIYGDAVEGKRKDDVQFETSVFTDRI